MYIDAPDACMFTAMLTQFFDFTDICVTIDMSWNSHFTLFHIL